MADASFEEDVVIEDNKAELERLKQLQRKQRLQNLARLGQKAANLAGQAEVAALLGEGADISGSKGNSMAARAATNKLGQKAGNYAQKTGGLSAGQGAAIGGAVAGAVQGQGVTGIARSALSWYILWFAFGFLTIGVITSPTIVGLVGAILALIYLDFHFLVSHFAPTFFVRMTIVQKTILFLANLIVFIAILIPIAVFAGATCAATQTSGYQVFITGLKSTPLTGFLGSSAELIASHYCSTSTTSVPFDGGRSGGGGATGPFDPTDLVSLLGLVNVDSQTKDPRARQCMADKLVEIFRIAGEQGLSITITSAYRGDGTTAEGGTSAHSRGEAVDIALRNPTAALYSNDPRIARLVAIAKSVGFVPPAGDTLDEYARPAANATGGHVHVEFNIPSSGSYCDGTAL